MVKCGVIFQLAIAFGVMISAPAIRAESAQDKQCREALSSFNAGGWNTEQATLLGRCPDDIRRYVSYLAAIRANGSDENAREQQSSLRTAANAGNRSAQILFTVLFTGLTDSPFLREIEGSDYSRYRAYIAGWDIVLKDPYLARFIVKPAVADGVVETYLILHVANYAAWRHGKWPGDKASAAIDMLIVEQFYPDNAIRPYLRRLLSVSDTEMQEFDRYASLGVGDILLREEVRHCRLDKQCAADSNMKRLICDIRTSKGDSLLTLEHEACDKVSAPLVRLYRAYVGDIIKGMVSSR